MSEVERAYAQSLQEMYNARAYLCELWHFEEQLNFYRHIAHLNEYSPSFGLEAPTSFVICGAGPSLETHFKGLKEHDFGILLPVSTAMNIINDAGLQADLGAAFDGKKSGARRLQSSNAFTIPFFVDVDSAGSQYIEGPKFLTVSADLPSWKKKILTFLGVQEQLLQLGPCITSTHYALELALALKATSITLLGVDLAYKDGVQYAGRKTWLLDEDVARTDLLLTKKNQMTSPTYYQEGLIYSHIAASHSNVNFNHWEQGARVKFEENRFSISYKKIQQALLEWKNEIEHSPDELLKRYRERLALVKDVDEESFCKKIVQFHLRAIEEALLEMREENLKFFYDNGQLKREIGYNGGKRNGISRFYSRSGRLLEEGYYRDGIPVGTYQQWNQKGYLEKRVISHEEGGFEVTEWDEKGNVIREEKSDLPFSLEAKKTAEAIRKDLEQNF